jgi:hypothetical protein
MDIPIIQPGRLLISLVLLSITHFSQRSISKRLHRLLDETQPSFYVFQVLVNLII